MNSGDNHAAAGGKWRGKCANAHFAFNIYAMRVNFIKHDVQGEEWYNG